MSSCCSASTAIYSFFKDIFLFLKGEKEDIGKMEDRLRTLISRLASINSRKQNIDRLLGNSGYKKSGEYAATENSIRVLSDKVESNIKKYEMLSGNQLSSEIDQVSSMISELGDLKTKKLKVNVFRLARLSRRIVELSEQADEILRRLDANFMVNKSGPIQEPFDDSNNLQVFDRYVGEILNYLHEERNSTVGIFGPKGVGKTTVLRKLYNQLIECSSDFEHVIMTEYPAELVEKLGTHEKNVENLRTHEKIVEKLQKEIMGQLGMDQANGTYTVQQNEIAISAVLGRKKYILLIDHVSSGLNLAELGLREAHKFKKVVIASRDANAVRQMTQHKIEIKRLTDEDGRLLFESIYGKLIVDSMNGTAQKIIECCAGIPWIICHVARYLKDKDDEGTWRSVKSDLQSNHEVVCLMDLDVYCKVYEIQYNELSNTKKKCLLYGALFPIQYKISVDYLVECWIAEGFMVKHNRPIYQKVRKYRESGRGILNDLTDRHLLQWCCDKQYIMMPPDFRRVASERAYPGEDKCEIWTPSKEGMPDADTWRVVKRMSLIDYNIELPQSPESCNICTLLLQSLKPNLEQLADSFFCHMQKLQVLDLNHTEISALPESINSLKNLKSLYLNDCMCLKKLPSEAKKLKKLEFLDISGTLISSLPQEIRHMVDLRCLRATLSVKRIIHNSKGKQVEGPKIIPRDIISKLGNLEELSIDTTFDSEDGKYMASELASLKYLNKLCFNFPDVRSLDTFVSQSKALNNKDTEWESATLRSFKISIGGGGTQYPYESDFSAILAERWLRFYSTNEAFSPACQELLNQASAFEIIGHHGIESLNQFDLRSVQACVVRSCNKLKCIVDGNPASEELGFVRERLPQNLEKLYLHKLDFLEYICDGPVPSQGLTNLTAIAINDCNKLTKILDPALAHTLQSLEKLKVENCCKVLNIIEADGRANNSGRGETSEIEEVREESTNSEQSDLSSILKSLRTIEMSNLPELQRICTSDSISWNSLNSIIVKSCSKLSNLSLTSTNAKKLRLIQGEEKWWSSLMFSEDQAQRLLPLFQPLTRESSEPGPGAGPEGAASSSGQSGFNGAVMASFGEAVTEDTTSRRNSSIDPPVPLENDAQRELEEEATINESHMDKQAEGFSFSPEDGIAVVPRVQGSGIYLNNGINGGKNRREEEEEESVELLTEEVLREEGCIQALNEGGTNDSAVQGVGIET